MRGDGERGEVREVREEEGEETGGKCVRGVNREGGTGEGEGTRKEGRRGLWCSCSLQDH